MKLRLTHPLSQLVLASAGLVAFSVACSATRSETSPPQASENVIISQSSPTPVVATNEEKTPCTLSMAAAPAIKGLKLGMTTDEVVALFPGSKEDPDVRSRLSQPNQFGTSTFLIMPSKYANREEFVEISQITFTLLDGRVSQMYVGFNGPEWPHVDKFVAKFIERTTLPAVDQWSPYVGLDNQLKTLTCVDFEVRVFTGGTGGNLNYVQMQDLEADKKLKERKRKAQEQASPTPGRQ